MAHAEHVGRPINDRGEVFHCRVLRCRWRAQAGVIGQIADNASRPRSFAGQAHEWKRLTEGRPRQRFADLQPDGDIARCELVPGPHGRSHLHHFGLLPVLKAWDSPGEVWLDDVTVNGVAFDFGADPKWDGLNNRRTYVTTDTRPRFDFGWSPTRHAGGRSPGELGGLIFRGDCREPARMACYGDPLETLTLKTPLYARGTVSLLRGVSDSTASIGFYHSTWSMQSNPSQQHSIPMDYLGINIEGPSSEGFFFYPVYRVHGEAAKALGGGGSKAPRIYPDRQAHDWFLKYDPEGANGCGQITVGLDDQTCTLDLEAGHKDVGASFDRFGLCTPWIDGNSVTVYFDDLTYTCAPAAVPGAK